MLLLTQSRTGLIVASIEIGAWLLMRPRERKQPSAKLWLGFMVAVSLSWMWPRLALDGSILNRPKIWHAGLQLFAANLNGVGLGNSGTLASAFMLDGIPPVRTMINSHITLLAEFGWLVGLGWLAFVLFALYGVRQSPRIGIAFFGLSLSACASTVFDWAVLFDAKDYGRLGIMNWISAWLMFLLFVGFGLFLIVRTTSFRRVIISAVAAAALVCVPSLLPVANVPVVKNGVAIVGHAPRTLALYDRTWLLESVCRRVGSNIVVPIHPIPRFPADFDLAEIDRVMLFGDCQEWTHLVKGVPVECVED